MTSVPETEMKPMKDEAEDAEIKEPPQPIKTYVMDNERCFKVITTKWG